MYYCIIFQWPLVHNVRCNYKWRVTSAVVGTERCDITIFARMRLRVITIYYKPNIIITGWTSFFCRSRLFHNVFVYSKPCTHVEYGPRSRVGIGSSATVRLAPPVADKRSEKSPSNTITIYYTYRDHVGQRGIVKCTLYRTHDKRAEGKEKYAIEHDVCAMWTELRHSPAEDETKRGVLS